MFVTLTHVFPFNFIPVIFSLPTFSCLAFIPLVYSLQENRYAVVDVCYPEAVSDTKVLSVLLIPETLSSNQVF